MRTEPAAVSVSAAAATPAPRWLGNTWRFAAIVAGGVLLGGLVLDGVLGGRGVPAPRWPDSGWALAIFLAGQAGGWALMRGTPLLAGLKGTRLAVVTLALLGLWALVLGTFPQVQAGTEAALYQRILNAPPFVGLLLLLIANLGWAILDHLAGGLKIASLFLFNHIGVYLALLGGLFGAGDVVRLDVWVKEGDLAWTGQSGTQRQELPFAVHLHRFTVEHYPPEVTLIDGRDGAVLLPPGRDPLTLHPNTSLTWEGYRIEVREVTSNAPWSAPGDVIPAAYLSVTAPDGTPSNGWVSSGSRLMPPVFLAVGEQTAMAMPVPRARLYESLITVIEPEAVPQDTVVRVNQPVKVAGWWLYQKGYNLDNAPSTRLSQLEAVRDPWLPVVYTGLALMAMGSLLAIGRAGQLLRASQNSGVCS